MSEDGDPPKVESSEPAPPAGFAVDWAWAVFGVPTSVFRSMAALALPVSAALYVLGFVVALIYFHRVGVPGHAITHANVVAAGLLYTFLTEAPQIEGMFIAHKRMRFLPGVVWLLTPPMFLSSWLWALGATSVIPVLIYWMLFCGAVWAVRYLRQRRRPAAVTQVDADSPFSNFLFPVGGRLAMAGCFAILIFPSLPQTVGGGRPRAVEITWKRPAAVYQLLGANSASASAPICGEQSCVKLLEVSSDDRFVYLEVLEKTVTDGECLAAFRVSRWALTPYPGAASRYVAVPREEIAAFHYSGD